MAAKFKLGDIVELKSGGPAMTVVHTDEDGEASIRVCWFTETCELKSGALPTAALRKSDAQRG